MFCVPSSTHPHIHTQCCLNCPAVVERSGNGRKRDASARKTSHYVVFVNTQPNSWTAEWRRRAGKRINKKKTTTALPPTVRFILLFGWFGARLRSILEPQPNSIHELRAIELESQRIDHKKVETGFDWKMRVSWKNNGMSQVFFLKKFFHFHFSKIQVESPTNQP